MFESIFEALFSVLCLSCWVLASVVMVYIDSLLYSVLLSLSTDNPEKTFNLFLWHYQASICFFGEQTNTIDCCFVSCFMIRPLCICDAKTLDVPSSYFFQNWPTDTIVFWPLWHLRYPVACCNQLINIIKVKQSILNDLHGVRTGWMSTCFI